MTNGLRHIREKETKSWLPYEWFDNADKLDYKGLPPYWCWYSQLRNSFVLTAAEYEECNRVFQERGMKTFRARLEYYNNLDVTPFLETLDKMKAFYTKIGWRAQIGVHTQTRSRRNENQVPQIRLGTYR